ncbi:probable carboxylesterase 7 [Salvia miltiorrhiza]|uniref:probable carboxylesterase 7 n=1 Tax=Salvia miltiorrhiza TaxID=226208 RepID=UPI0025AD76E4|nr:probable carboxylesterase 7 [Salvia miltiorrhiza]
MANEILHDFFPLLRVYKNGRIERLMGQETVPPSLDPATGVQSKDVDIAPEINLSARIYLPPNADRSKKLPLLVYYHGGAFIIESAFSSQYQKHLNHLVAQANDAAGAFGESGRERGVGGRGMGQREREGDHLDMNPSIRL